MGLADKMLLLYLCISLAFAFWQPGIVFGLATPLSFYNLEYNETQQDFVFRNESIFNEGTDESFERLQQQGREDDKDANPINQYLWVIDPVWNIIKFLILLVSVIAAPATIMLSAPFAGAPTFILLAFALPTTIMGFIAVAMFIRGVN